MPKKEPTEYVACEEKQPKRQRNVEERKEERRIKAFTKFLKKRNGRHGVCCRAFSINLAPDEALAELKRINDECITGMLTPHRTRNSITTLVSLLKPLHSSYTHGHWYTCRAFNKTGTCEIHESKPVICQLFKPIEAFCVKSVKCKSWKLCKQALEVTTNDLRSATPKGPEGPCPIKSRKSNR